MPTRSKFQMIMESKKWKRGFKVGAKNGLVIPTGELNDCVVKDIDLFDLKEITACKFIKNSITMISRDCSKNSRWLSFVFQI